VPGNDLFMAFPALQEIPKFDPYVLLSGGPVRPVVDTSLLCQMRSNSKFDPVVVPVGYQFGHGDQKIRIPSGKCPDPTQPWYGEREFTEPKTELSFEDWVDQSDLAKPTSESYQLWFGPALVRPIKNSSKSPDKTRLLTVLPRLNDSTRSELSVRASERKQLFKVHTKYMRERAPELFRHTVSMGGPADLRPNCVRCGGSYNVFKSDRERIQHDQFVCGDCGQEVRVKSFEDHRTDEERLDDLNSGDLHGVDNVIRNKVVQVEAVEDIRRKLATILISGKYKGDIATRFALLTDHQTNVRPGWTLKDYADSHEVPEETAKTWVSRFRKQITEYNGPLVELNEETRRVAARILGF
jgi:hypothetical protein